ncbi:MAG: hypothetical protein HC840_26430 [Leptolyngbyaceae cyanobacterium RM2_2_4]|nr:hypothetical protein [Leptolyngbyaceae cyanobacterium RM2_2_4]
MSPHQELTLTLAAPDNNPILLTPTFLKGSGIIPPRLATRPSTSPHALARRPQRAYNSDIETSVAKTRNLYGQPHNRNS